MNKRFDKTFVITTEYESNGVKTVNSKVFRKKSGVVYGYEFLNACPKGNKRHVEIYTITHILTRTKGRVSKKKAVVVEKKA
jgi:hypothetical protein